MRRSARGARRSLDRRSDIIRFGADGWNARFTDCFTEENVARVADALALMWADASPGATVYVGYDTRHASADLARTVAGVLASYGLVVRVSETACPTPAVAWTCAHDPSAVGAVILTASERSCEFGGLIVRDADGGPVTRKFLDGVEQTISAVPTSGRGAFEERDIMTPYLRSLASRVDRDAIASARPKVVVDPMYGAAAGHLAGLLSRLGCEVIEIHGEPREDFGGIHPDPQDPWADACEQAVVANGADIGVVLDGDADRAGVVDERGSVLPARTITPLILGHVVEGHGARGRVVSTLACSACVARQASRLGCEHTSVPVGFSRIYGELREGDVLFGAEEYGGICIPDHLRERDGLLVCLLAVEMLVVSGMSVTEQVAELESKIGSMRYARRDVRLDPAVTQTLRNVLPGLNPSELAGRTPVEVSHGDGLRLQFEDDSWVLIRPSRAGSLVRVYAEAPTGGALGELLSAACSLARLGPLP